MLSLLVCVVTTHSYDISYDIPFLLELMVLVQISKLTSQVMLKFLY